jgi:hypothetical protein
MTSNAKSEWFTSIELIDAEPDQLRVLAVLARHESVTETAKELHYSQP